MIILFFIPLMFILKNQHLFVNINDTFNSIQVNWNIKLKFLLGILTLIFDLNQLIDLLSIGTLMAYSVVAICVVILRYRPNSDSGLTADRPQIATIANKDQQLNVAEEKKDNNKIEPSHSLKDILSVFFLGHSNESIFTRCFSPRSSCTRASSCLVNTITVLSRNIFDLNQNLIILRF